MGRTQVFDWFCQFKEGSTSVESDPRSGWPSTSRNKEMIAKVRTIICNNRRLTVREIADDCDVCMNQFAENDRKNRGIATGSCTTTMCLHTLHILWTSFWPNMAPLSCSSCHTHQILHRVTFSYSQGLRKFWKDNGGHQMKFVEDTIRHPERGVRKMFPTVAATLGEVCSCRRELCWRQLGLKLRKLYLLHILWSVLILFQQTSYVLLFFTHTFMFLIVSPFYC